ncbi:hypothetical protein [Vibrio splendidus]|uniref:hypothetical protein n=1 Tax=Vibrio splendidus TaxID=29497 RepID=UPI000D3D9677|nr:hypothetical protein [Vibrio splendidus]PTP10071.1 hypothetical protein CWN86_00025 [Vibrio splendidus]PTP26531.1 hypothetical protein CWN85_02350 [Vibrio splendidus]PTP68671.1 hypothetical protein CWO31_04645 [Vibrio splendidus]
MDTKSAIYTCLGAIFASAITAGVMYYNNERTLEAKIGEAEKQRVELRKQVVDNKKLAKILISNTYVPRINTNIDSVFYTEISNESENTSNNTLLTINFGGTEIRACETLPLNHIKPESIKNGSVLNIENLKLLSNEKLYVYCQTSSPIFESITVSGENLAYRVSQNFASMKLKTVPKSGNPYGTFFKVIGCIVALIFIGYFTLAGIVIANKRLKPYMD